MRTIEQKNNLISPQLHWQSGQKSYIAGTVFCIGRNYAEHANELGNELPDEPLVFLKSRNTLIGNNSSVKIPEYSDNMHYEAEMVLLIGGDGHNIHLSGIGIGIDFTLRDLQDKIKVKGQPWTKAKNFLGAAAISEFADITDNSDQIDYDSLTVKLEKNGEIMQESRCKHMIFPVFKTINFINENYGLNPGDLIYTGTPAGVGPVKKGDDLKASLSSDTINCEVNINII
jgi:2-keto-4-pentenoate hydratase/2-oxohepta-3-ene-1,7-dioic acid hydratase in catechol pathway